MLPLLPLFAVDLGATPLFLGVLTAVFAVLFACGQVLGGRLVERHDPRRLVMIGIGVYAGANLALGLTTTLVSLLLLRAVAGLGAGVDLVSERVYIGRSASQDRLAFINGTVTGVGALGQIAGPAIAGLIVGVSSYGAPFLLVGATSAVACVAALWLPRIPSRSEPITALDEDTDQATHHPSSRTLRLLLIGNFFYQMRYGLFITLYGPFAFSYLGWSLPQVGYTYAALGIGSLILGPWLSRMADRTGRRRAAVLACLAPSVLAALLVAGPGPAVIYAFAIIAGGADTLFQACWYALLIRATDGAQSGRAFGRVTAGSTLGIVAGGAVASVAWQLGGLATGMLSVCILELGAAGAMATIRGEGLERVPPAG
jgi:MFS family permease